jgi:bis(5'-nucleosyl)-tetraphosphatase (symmetrical)
MMRWLVGDIQGCAAEFETLLETIKFEVGVDELWCLGDLVNKGPDSLGVLRLWRDVGGHGVLGNHDIYALQAHAGRIPRGQDSLDRLFEAEDGEALLKRLRAMPVLVHLPAETGVRDVWVVHAGLHPQWTDLVATARRLNAAVKTDWPHISADVELATNIRCCTATGAAVHFTGLPGDCPEPFRAWDDFYDGDAMIVHGHWARRGFYRTPRTMGLDSGCVYGGTLTAWCQEEDRIVEIVKA